MGRNRRKKKVRAVAAGGSGEGEEETRRLEEPLLPNATPRSPVSIPKPRVAPPPALDLVAASFDEAPSAETLTESLLRREAPSPRLPNATPRSPVSIPKPRVAASFDEAPSAETLAEPLLRREAPSPRPGARRSRDGDVRLSVTFQEPSPVQDEEGKARTLVPPAAYRTTKRRRTRVLRRPRALRFRRGKSSPRSGDSAGRWASRIFAEWAWRRRTASWSATTRAATARPASTSPPARFRTWSPRSWLCRL